MKKFEIFLDEGAQISQSNVIKAMVIFKKVLSKYAGSEVEPYGGEYENYAGIGSSGQEYILCAKDDRAWGFNYVGGEFTSISVWKKGKFKTLIDKRGDPSFSSADATINLTEVDNITKLGHFMKDILINPKAGSFVLKNGALVKEEYESDKVLITEAKRIKDKGQFWKMVAGAARKLKYDPARMSQADLDRLVIYLDISLPVYVKGYGKGEAPKTGRGKNATWDLTVFSDTPSQKVDVHMNDNVGKRTHSAEIDPDLPSTENTFKTWRERIENPSKQDMNRYGLDPDSLFFEMGRSVEQLAKLGDSLFIVGGPGIGKSYVVTQKLKELGYTELNADNIDENTDTTDPRYYTLIKGSVSLPKMVQIFFKCSRAGQIVMIDDGDGFLDNKETANVLKALLDSSENKWLTWDSKAGDIANISVLSSEGQKKALEILYNINNGKAHLYEPEEMNVGGDPVYDKNDDFANKWTGGVPLVTKDFLPKVPNKFKYAGKVLFISNRQYADINSAVRSRIQSVVDMTLSAPEVAARMKNLINMGVLGKKDVPKHVKHEIIDIMINFLDENKLKPENLNMRTFLSCELAYRTFKEDKNGWRNRMQFSIELQ